MSSLVDPWLQPNVARAQRELVEMQLCEPLTIPPFAAFIETMRGLDLRGKKTLLDAGCGCGHYGVLCASFFPSIIYFGVDYSSAMIEQAKNLCWTGTFHVRAFEDVNFGGHNIVLVSQVLEYQPDPFAALARVLEGSPRGYVILHRLRLTEGASHRTESEECYCGYSAPNYEWNLADLEAFTSARGKRIRSYDKWDGHATVVMDKE